MLKKLYILIRIIFTLSVFGGCSDDSANNAEEIPPWIGQYVMINEETEEFKVLTIEEASEEEVVFSFESARGKDEFTGILKTKSKKYAVCNAGDRCLKFDLKSSSTVVAVDDIWTNTEAVRNENWTGKYRRLEEFEEIEEFGDSSWNGRYTCAENEITIEVCGIKEGLVLLSYREPKSGEKLEYKCSITNDSERKAVCWGDNRKLEIKLVRSNKTIVIEDKFVDETLTELSGRYTR